MAIYSTVFLCEPSRVASGFPGWKTPLPKAVSRRVVDRLTGQEIVVSTREPEWDDDGVDAGAARFQVTRIKGDYGTYLESRLPPFVQSQPHWCSKDITSVELQPLLNVVTDSQMHSMEPVLFAPPSRAAFLEEFPAECVSRLQPAAEFSIRRIAKQWAAIMSTPQYTHSVTGIKVEEDWTTDMALGLLRPLAELAGRRGEGQEMYLLVEW